MFTAPLIGRIARLLGFIPASRGGPDAARALDAAAAAIEAGEAVGLYPEGRITRDPAMWPERSKTGAVRLALRTGAPIVPVAMVGAHELVGRRRNLGRLVRNLILRPKIAVEVGEPIDVGALVGHQSDPPPETIRHAADVVMGRLIGLVAKLRDEEPIAPHGVDVA